MTEASWPFEDPPDLAVFTTPSVLDGQPIQRVHHDEDGYWTFQISEADPADISDFKIVSFALIFKLEPGLVHLAELPRGWSASRRGADWPWVWQDERPLYTLDSATERQAAFPVTFRIPPEEERRSLAVGDLVKLMFRIRTPEGTTVERMWVKVRDLQPDWNYLGTLDNDAYCHPDVHCGLTVEFTADEVIAIDRAQA